MRWLIEAEIDGFVLAIEGTQCRKSMEVERGRRVERKRME